MVHTHTHCIYDWQEWNIFQIGILVSIYYFFQIIVWLSIFRSFNWYYLIQRGLTASFIFCFLFITKMGTKNNDNKNSTIGRIGRILCKPTKVFSFWGHRNSRDSICKTMRFCVIQNMCVRVKIFLLSNHLSHWSSKLLSTRQHLRHHSFFKGFFLLWLSIFAVISIFSFHFFFCSFNNTTIYPFLGILDWSCYFVGKQFVLI